MKQNWDFFEEQLEVAEKREMTVGRFVTAANEVTIGGFWREHARGELRTRRDHEILEFLSPCWSVQRERDHLWSLHTGNIEYAHQSVAGTVPGLPKVPVQCGPSIHVQSGRGHTPD